MVSLDYEVKTIIISGTANSTDSAVNPTRFEIPVTVRIPVGCEEITLEWKNGS